MSQNVRQRLLDAAVAMNAHDINSGTSGNLSVRTGEGMLITPSGLAYDTLTVEDLVTVDFDGSSSGRHRPSSEWRIHVDIYRKRADAGAIVHAHPVHCTALACQHRGIPAFHYMVAVAGGNDIPCASYATFGSQALSDNVLAALAGRNACLMANHGMIAVGASPLMALRLVVEIENLARTYCASLAIGEPDILDDEEMARVLERFGDYGPGDE